jgi:hypothetical protein
MYLNQNAYYIKQGVVGQDGRAKNNSCKTESIFNQNDPPKNIIHPNRIPNSVCPVLSSPSPLHIMIIGGFMKINTWIRMVMLVKIREAAYTCWMCGEGHDNPTAFLWHIRTCEIKTTDRPA